MTQWQPQQGPRQPRRAPAVPPQFRQEPPRHEPRYAPAPQPVYQPRPPQHYAPPVRPKSPSTGLLLGLLLPGAGCMYAGRVVPGTLILLLWLVSIPLAFFAVGIFTGLVLWVLSAILGYTMTREWNAARGVAA